jgi:hypothetical protein
MGRVNSKKENADGSSSVSNSMCIGLNTELIKVVFFRVSVKNSVPFRTLLVR